MAVKSNDSRQSPRASAGRRFLVGTNVILATVLVIAVVVVVQAIAYSVPRRWDMTTSGINSLSEGTENLLRRLDANVRITSLYFETDREEADQPRYRQAARDLIGLYEATNRSKVATEWVNPLKDHEPYRTLLNRLRDKTAFKEQVGQYREAITRYTDDLDGKMHELVQSELSRLHELGGPMADSNAQSVVAPIERVLRGWPGQLDALRDQVDRYTGADNPQDSAAVDELRRLYREFSKLLTEVGEYGSQQVQVKNLPAPYAGFLGEARKRYEKVKEAVEAENTKLQALEPLKVDDVSRELVPTANPILVETDDDAIVVDFSSVWPPIREGGAGQVGFGQRAFKGEEKLTSAILRVTHKEQTAVVFVRYGGNPLFLERFAPQQPPGAYTAMKQQLEDANFIVEEWDVKSGTTPPVIDPKPTRVLYVVLKPTPPQRGPMGQPSQEPPFGETQRRAVLDAIGPSGRALFIAGWSPGPFGPIASEYEYDDYLTKEWGVHVDTSALLIETTNIAPGQYAIGRQDWYAMRDLSVTSHDIVTGALAREVVLPMCAPLELTDPPPEGVNREGLIHLPKRDGVWGVKDLSRYQEQSTQREYLTKVEGDMEGRFDLAVAAAKGDAKVVVVSSSDFAVDAVAFAREFAVTSEGLAIRSRNPGNVTLLVNSLHWLNDNTEFMNIGKPIEAAVLQIPQESVRAVRVLTISIWPALALVCGGVVWWVRRR